MRLMPSQTRFGRLLANLDQAIAHAREARKLGELVRRELESEDVEFFYERNALTFKRGQLAAECDLAAARVRPG